MRHEYLKHRAALYFETTASEFANECKNLVEIYSGEWVSALPERKKEIEWIIGSIAIDAMSYIPDWAFKATEGNPTEALRDGYKIFIDKLTEWKAEDQIAATEKEVWELVNSNLIRVSRLNDLGLLNTPVGTDSAWELIHSSRHGMSVATTNPVMVDTVRQKYPDVWDPVRDRIAKEYAGASNEEKVTRFTIEVAKYNCEVLLPIFKHTKGRLGYVHMQVNPHNAHDWEAMAKEAEYAYAELKKEFGDEPNIIFKIPAVKAAPKAVERLVGQGICVTMTASASVSQHKLFGEIFSKGKAKLQLLTMMAGRFDDPIIEELQMAGIPDDEALSLARRASNIVLHRSYAMLRDEMKAHNYWLLTASMRVPGNIEAAFNNGDEKLILTIFPPQAEEYESVLRPIYPHVGESVDEESLKKLMLSEIFRKGYEYDGLTIDEYDDWKVVSDTLNQFCSRYDDTVAYLNE